MKRLALIPVALLALSACEREANVASRNLSVAADQFEIERHVSFINGITGDEMLRIEGRCSIKDEGHQLEVTCKTASNQFAKHFLGLSDNVTYIAEQVELADVSVFHHRVVFRPQALIPDVDFEGDIDELLE